MRKAGHVQWQLQHGTVHTGTLAPFTGLDLYLASREGGEMDGKTFDIGV
jgi:hypothetical protein